MPHEHRIEPGQVVRLADMPTDAKHLNLIRAEAEAEFRALRTELIELQARLYAEGKRKLLVVLQAMDAGGKDGTIRRIFRGVNPQGVRVTSFKSPSDNELAHDFLWRIHQAVPGKGMIGVFNRSQYEDVLVVRVHSLVPETVWRPRYEQINNFEKMLADSGTRILKFYLHISKKEQKKRFQARLDDPTKRWKFAIDDLGKRKHWDEYMVAFEEMLTRCSTPWAPWYAIPADQKWYRNLTMVRTLVHTIKEMDPQYPSPKAGLDNILVE